MIDEDGDGLINFREFAQGLGVICKGETQDRMLFMYRMHVPPAISDAESVNSCVELKESGSTENLTSQSCDQSQSRDQAQAQAHGVSEEVPISAVLPRAGEIKERKISENTEDTDKRVTEIPAMSQVLKSSMVSFSIPFWDF